MDFVTVLAQAVETTTETTEEAVVPLDLIWEHVTSLGLLEALTFISFGAVCLLYGWRVFKVLVVISFAMLGLALGIKASGKISGEDQQFLGGIIGLGVFGALSIPLMRWAVSILGAVAGGILTSGIWYACKLPEEYIWAGGLIGVVAGGMISFIIFRIAVMLFSSLGGALLIATGVLALLYLNPETTEKVQELVFNEKWFLPVALLAPTAIGIVMQNRFVKDSKEWDI